MNRALTIEFPGGKLPKIEINGTNICLVIMLLCGLSVGILPKAVTVLAVLACSVVLVVTRGIWMAFPIMIFYYESFGMFMGMSVYRYFSLLFFVFILLNCTKIPINFSHFVPLIIFLIYCIIVISPENLQRAIFAFFDVMNMSLLVLCFLNSTEALKKFFSVYVFTALCAFVTGVVRGRLFVTEYYLDGKLVEVVRNYATFEDPNYMGLFYSVALFSMMCLSLFHPVVRTIVAVTLSAMILTSLSITALIMNVVFWIVYLFIYKKINLITLCCFGLILVALVELYSYGVENPDAPVIGVFSLRIEEKLDSLNKGNINDVTTNRTNLTEYHWEYFLNQSTADMLLGMNATSTIKTDLDGFTVVAHNEYVDLLLNIGILGAFIYLVIMLARALKMFIRVRGYGDAYSGCIFMLKVIWLAYGVTLTMFGDYRFMLLFFI